MGGDWDIGVVGLMIFGGCIAWRWQDRMRWIGKEGDGKIPERCVQDARPRDRQTEYIEYLHTLTPCTKSE